MLFNGFTVDLAEKLSAEGHTDKAVVMLYSGPQSSLDSSDKHDVTHGAGDEM